MYSGILACYANPRILGFLPRRSQLEKILQSNAQCRPLFVFAGFRASATAMRFCAGLFGKDAALELLPQAYEHI